MTDIRELTKCRYFDHHIDRRKIRFGGIGPKLAREPGKIWPRDENDDESKKILTVEIQKLINNDVQYQSIKNVINRTFAGLRRCNINNLFNKCCQRRRNYFAQVPFKIYHALDVYTTHKEIMTLIHQTLRSLNHHKLPQEKDFVLTLFGCRKNLDIYKKHLAAIIGANSKYQSIKLGYIVSFGDTAMDLSKIAWLNGLDNRAVSEIFLQVIFAITRFFMELLRRYFYITISNPYRDMLFYYRYDLWQKLYSKGVQGLIHQGVLQQFKSQPPATLINQSKLKFYLKKDGLRPICTSFLNKGDQNLRKMKAVLRFVLTKSPHYQRFNLNNLMLGLRHMLKKQLDGDKKLYFVKADLKDCFQSIRQTKLRQIINEILRINTENGIIKIARLSCLPKARRLPGGKLKAGREFELWTLDPVAVRENPRYETVQESGRPMCLTIEEFDRLFLTPTLINPILRESRYSKNAYKLLKGIRQGSSLSPILCSIYISNAFNKYLSECLNSDDCRIFLHVDDILFLSTDLKMAKGFMYKMLAGFKDFNLRINLDKSMCNFIWSREHPDICSAKKDEILFFKQWISMKTLQCRYCYDNDGISLQYTFKVSPYSDRTAVRDEMLKSKIDLIHLDCELNRIDQLISNIYEKCLLFAHRAATMILVSMQLCRLDNQDPKFVKILLLIVAKRMYGYIKMGLKRKLIINNLTYPQIRLIASVAFSDTWERVKVRHRTAEHEALKRITSRYMMRYVIQDDVMGLWWKEKLRRLKQTNSSKSFFKHCKLPDKIY